MPGQEPQTGEVVTERPDQRTGEPPLFRVLLLNDDYTTMDFVVMILEEVFHKSPAEAFRIMMKVHREGRGLCGLYPFEVAETKATTVHKLARQYGFPLRASVEPE